MKRIILTGGGTAGHVTPNIALLPRLKVYHIMASQPVNSDVISASRTSQIHSVLSREWVKHVN